MTKEMAISFLKKFSKAFCFGAPIFTTASEALTLEQPWEVESQVSFTFKQ